MAEDKMCPLLSNQSERGWGKLNCQKEDCAWWDNIFNGCAILGISMVGKIGSFEAKTLGILMTEEDKRRMKK